MTTGKNENPSASRVEPSEPSEPSPNLHRHKSQLTGNTPSENYSMPIVSNIGTQPLNNDQGKFPLNLMYDPQQLQWTFSKMFEGGKFLKY